MKRWNWLLVPALFSVLGAALALSAAPQQANAATPIDVVRGFIVAVNTSDGAAAAANFTSDGIFNDISDGSFALVGTKALTAGFSDTSHLHVELQDVTSTGNTVTGIGRVSDDDSAAAGVQRYLQPFTAIINGDKIAEFRVTTDKNDPQTATYLAYLSAHEDPDQGPPPGALQLTLGPGRDGSQTGTAFLAEDEGLVFVEVQIAPGPAGVLQPAHVHTGDCPGVGAVASALAPVLDGASFTITSLSLSGLEAGDFAINVHKSQAEAGIYVACGEVESAVAVAAPTPAPPPAPVATPPAGVITAPSTGTGSASGGGNGLWLLAMVLLAGTALTGTGVAVRSVRRAR